MNVERVSELAHHLETRVPKNAFDMGSWMTYGYDPDTFAPNRKDITEALENEFKCGMKACLGGHAAAVFPKLLGLKQGFLFLKGDDSIEGARAIAVVLDIPLEVARDLTHHNAEHQTPKEAAVALMNLLKNDPETFSYEREYDE